MAWNDTSQSRLQGVDPRLTQILELARERSGIPFQISEGRRTQERQRQMVDQGKSQTMNSRHLHGNALDVHILNPDGTANWDFEAYRPLADAAKAAAAELGYDDFQWGGDWKTLKDGVHFQVGGGHSAPAGAPVTRVSTRNGAAPMTPDQSPWARIIAEAQKPRTKKDRIMDMVQAFGANAPRMYKGQTMDFRPHGGSGKATNASIAWLQQQGREDLAAAVAAKMISPKEAISILQSEGKGSDKTQFRPLTKAEAKAQGLDPTKGWQIGSDGKIHQIGGSGVEVNVGADGKPLTEGAAKATSQYTVMDTVSPVIDELDQQGTEFWQTVKPGFLQSPDFQRYNTAKLAWIMAVLRLESGAVIGDDEIRNKDLVYFPQPGDRPETIEYKKQLRDAARRGIKPATAGGTDRVEAPAGATPPPAAAPGTGALPVPEGADPNDPWNIL